MDKTSNTAAEARRKRKFAMMNKKQSSKSIGKENNPPSGQTSTTSFQGHSSSQDTPLIDSTANVNNTQHSKRQCRRKTNSFVRPVGVNLLHQFDGTATNIPQQQHERPQTSMPDDAERIDYLNNHRIGHNVVHNNPNFTDQSQPLDSDADSASTGDSESDLDVDDEILVDDHLQEFFDIGDPIWECQHCFACMWYGERMTKTKNTTCPKFQRCCHGGKVKLPLIDDPPIILQKLLFDNTTVHAKNYQHNIRTYNAMFSFTSPGMKFDNKFNKGGGPPTLRLHGQVCHRIGTLLPENGQQPKYAQLYIFDTDNEINNRMECFSDNKGIDRNIVTELREMLDQNNVLAKAFRMARDVLKDQNVNDLKLRLISERQTDGRVYNKPTISEVAALIVGDIDSGTKRDIIIKNRGGGLQRIDEFHPSYLAFQYPLLFPYGEDGYRDNILHSYKGDTEVTKRNRQTILEWLSFRLQHRKCEATTILSSRRLFHQLLVDGYTMMETERLIGSGKINQN